MADKMLNAFDVWITAQGVKSRTRLRSVDNISLEGIARLRDLILELAVQGKLLSQSSKDEPASEQLKKIASERKKLIADNKLKRPKELQAIEGDAHSQLPKGWALERFGNIFNVINGRAYKMDEMLQVGTPILRVGNLFTSDEWYYSDLELEPEKYIDNGDLIYAWSASFGPFIWQGERVIYHYHIWKLDPFNSESISKRFFLHYLNAITKSIKNSGNGIAMIHMTKERMEKLIVALPPLAEQHRIVAKVDELMALCDVLEQQETHHLKSHQLLVETLLGTLTRAADANEFHHAWNKLYEHFDDLFTTEGSIDQLKQTILQLAVMGKLVPQNPNDEPASELLKRIAKERERLVEERKLGKQGIIDKIQDSERSHQLPQGWIFARFGEIVFNRDAERIPLSVDERSTRKGEFDYYGASGVIDNIDAYLFDKPLLLIGEDGANLINRTTPIAFMARGKYWVNNHAHVIDGLSEGLLLYVCLYINAISLESFVTGTAQPKMNQAKMNSIVVALPPQQEQKRIVSKVDELFALCDRLKERIAEAQKVANLMVEGVVGQV